MFSIKSSSSDLLSKVLNAQRAGEAKGIYSVCSSNYYVLAACILQAKKDKSEILIESTVNQVNQFGGYMGMNPKQFVNNVINIANDLEFPKEKIIFGGDHLGPHVWSQEETKSAMAKSRKLVQDYIHAGYHKIHLDASMRCIDDPRDEPLSIEVAALRAAEMCEAAEITFSKISSSAIKPRYVIGTEVPSPGGLIEGEDEIKITDLINVEETIEVTKEAFNKLGLESAWERVIALVVQPGVDFGDVFIHEYDRKRAQELSKLIETHKDMIYEAHSTDFQTKVKLKEMVEDHFAILKVGPAFTYAFREAIIALEFIEREWLSGKRGVALSNIRDTLEQAMLDHPEYWQKYYSGDEADLQFARMYSYSDRSRYYWNTPKLRYALVNLLNNLRTYTIPNTLLRQFLPVQFENVRDGLISNTPMDLILDKITQVVTDYTYACGYLSSKVLSYP